MTTREQALTFLRGLKRGNYGATMTIYQDVVDHVLAEVDEQTARAEALLKQSAEWETLALEARRDLEGTEGTAALTVSAQKHLEESLRGTIADRDDLRAENDQLRQVMLAVARNLRARDRGTQRGLQWAYDAAEQLERSLGVDMRVTPEARWGVFDVEERKWCPRFGSESQMSAHAARLNASLRPDAGAAYRYQPLPLPVPVRTETAG